MILSPTKKISIGWIWVGIGITYLLLIVIFFYWHKSFQPQAIEEQLAWMTPLFFDGILLLLIAGFLLSMKEIMDISALIPGRILIAILALSLVGILCSALIPVRTHRIYYDEDIYLQIGQNIANERKAVICHEGHIAHDEYRCISHEYNKQPNGWPYLISLVFRIFGVKELYIHLLNNLLYGLGIAVIFLITTLWFEDYWAGLYSAFIFALIPHNLVWSNTASAELPAAIFAGLAVLAAVFFSQKKTHSALFLLLAASTLAIQFRPESFLILPVVSLVLIADGQGLWKEPRSYAALALFGLLNLPHFMHLWIVRENPWGCPGGSKFSLAYLADNIKTNGIYYLNNYRFPVIFTLFFLAGLLLKRMWARRAIILLWFMSFWGIFLFFYAGSYSYGADVRYSLLSYMPLAILAGYGLSSVFNFWRKIRPQPYIIALFCFIFLFINFINFLPMIRAVEIESWESRADHRFALQMSKMLPADSIIFTHNPNIFLLNGKSAAQIGIALNNSQYMENIFAQFKGGVYFHYNFWCNVTCPEGMEPDTSCVDILKEYDHKIIKEFREENFRFALYRLELKRKS